MTPASGTGIVEIMSPSTTLVFHIHRKKGKPLILHDIALDPKTVRMLESANFEGRFGREPDPEGTAGIKNVLHERIERCVALWISEKRFLFRFAVAAAVFLVVYLFFSIVVKDPIPMIDELILGSVAAIIWFNLSERADLKGSLASAMRVELKTRVDSMYFERSAFAERVEVYFGLVDAEGINAIEESWREAFPVSDDEREEAGIFLYYLETAMKPAELKARDTILSAIVRDKKNDLKKVGIKSEKGIIDLAVIGLSARLRKSI